MPLEPNSFHLPGRISVPTGHGQDAHRRPAGRGKFWGYVKLLVYSGKKYDRNNILNKKTTGSKANSKEEKTCVLTLVTV